MLYSDMFRLERVTNWLSLTIFNTLRTGDADLLFYITTVQDG